MERSALVAGIFVIAGLTAFLSFLMSFLSARLAHRVGAMDQPSGGRKIHKNPIPLFGGIGIGASIIAAFVLLFQNGLLPGIEMRQLVGIILAIIVLLVGGAIDDIRPRTPIVQICFVLAAAIIVVISGTGIVQVTNLGGPGGFSLAWQKFSIFNFQYSISLPADLITIAWLMIATYATKLLDGLDGLVAGMAVIGSTMVGALTLSPAYYQPGVAMVAGSMAGAFFGFLPRNIHPAKQFLGEAGSTLAGFTLGVLAILSSAKVAIALSVLAIPLADALFVVLGRLRRGSSPWKGDDTHLHFRLLKIGIPHRAAVVILWGISFSAGVIALSLQTRGKLFLVATLAALTGFASWFASRAAARRSRV